MSPKGAIFPTLRQSDQDFSTPGEQTHTVALNIFVQRDVPAVVVGDRERLATVFTNLLGNAVKFTPASGAVSFAVRRADNDSAVQTRLRFEVADTGVGIELEAQNRIFDTFTQADNTIVDRFGGAGLGLATCRSLVKLHGGAIGVSSEPGEGSLFWVELPLASFDSHSAPGVRKIAILAMSGSSSKETMLGQRLERSGASVHRVMINSGDNSDELPNSFGAEEEHSDAILVDEGSLDAARRYRASLPKPNHPIPIIPILECSSSGWDYKWTCLTTINWSDDDDAVERALGLISSHMPPSTTVPFPLVPASRLCRVLVADDNPTNQTIVKKFLENVGHAVDLVATGRQALLALETVPYDIVVMDVNMPDLNGLDAAREYRKTHQTRPRVPILGLTADTSEEMAERCRQSGIDARLIKPINNADLADAVQKWVAREEVGA